MVWHLHVSLFYVAIYKSYCFFYFWYYFPRHMLQPKRSPPPAHQSSVSRKSWVRSDPESPYKTRHLFSLTWLLKLLLCKGAYTKVCHWMAKNENICKRIGSSHLHRTQASPFTIFVVVFSLLCRRWLSLIWHRLSCRKKAESFLQTLIHRDNWMLVIVSIGLFSFNVGAAIIF